MAYSIPIGEFSVDRISPKSRKRTPYRIGNFNQQNKAKFKNKDPNAKSHRQIPNRQLLIGCQTTQKLGILTKKSNLRNRFFHVDWSCHRVFVFVYVGVKDAESSIFRGRDEVWICGWMETHLRDIICMKIFIFVYNFCRPEVPFDKKEMVKKMEMLFWSSSLYHIKTVPLFPEAKCVSFELTSKLQNSSWPRYTGPFDELRISQIRSVPSREQENKTEGFVQENLISLIVAVWPSSWEMKLKVSGS